MYTHIYYTHTYIPIHIHTHMLYYLCVCSCVPCYPRVALLVYVCVVIRLSYVYHVVYVIGMYFVV